MTSYLIINSFKKFSPDVILNADGPAKQNALLENRQFAHSELLSTGYFANDYELFTITLKNGFDNKNVYLQVG
ncbi:MAG: hypothetical protein EIB84_05295 [Spiroplasma poulsonii]|uniref:Uncharacterized protein n=1 Tax=Spiroplasma poulsonii TaxID=2138 RepID=A0A2P6FDF6_9MOLU|nr:MULTISPECIES: hypothetical protein [Spiroplasma]KAF0850868.1 hypothetical protein MSROBK_013490 [Spiroplasma poulsonii]MBH8622816.1 hypothetical protein [Spiroplasma sp. hyd1]MBW1242210.1 hypothetical protein [Spiroplasma poulsonii]PQM31491.1 hypothetical protein SMSRO_SF013260 [Spiroplasma poulsonii]PWF96506.1 hypothetical protein SMSE_19530 [Spiroplasma poulsonii]